MTGLTIELCEGVSGSSLGLSSTASTGSLEVIEASVYRRFGTSGGAGSGCDSRIGLGSTMRDARE